VATSSRDQLWIAAPASVCRSRSSHSEPRGHAPPGAGGAVVLAHPPLRAQADSGAGLVPATARPAVEDDGLVPLCGCAVRRSRDRRTRRVGPKPDQIRGESRGSCRSASPFASFVRPGAGAHVAVSPGRPLPSAARAAEPAFVCAAAVLRRAPRRQRLGRNAVTVAFDPAPQSPPLIYSSVIILAGRIQDLTRKHHNLIMATVLSLYNTF
jgi:hypothetical protein